MARTSRKSAAVAAQSAVQAAGIVAVPALPSSMALVVVPQPAPEVAAEPEVVPVLGKYGKVYGKLGIVPAACAPGWRYANTALVVGPFKPQKDTTVFGRIYNLVAQNSGLTGAQLVTLMQEHGKEFASTAAVKYAGNGKLCGMWCQGYINGALRESHGHLATA